MNQIISICLLALVALTACQPAQQGTIATESLREDAFFLANDSLEGREMGSSGEHQAGVYIVKRFRDAGLIPLGSNGYYQPFKVTPDMNPHITTKSSHHDSTSLVGNNIIGMIDNPENKTIIIGAHYDHLGYGGAESLHRGDTSIHNGADDNASGVAVLIWLAHKLQKLSLSKDLLFIAFSGEEKGLWGSNFFCKNPTVKLINVDAMINLDMVGRLDKQRGLAINGTGTCPSWPSIIQGANTDSLHLIMRPSGVGPSDHTSFYLKNIPVLHFFTGQHKDYHKPGDDAEKLNYPGMELIANLIERIIKDVDKKNMTFTKTKDSSTKMSRFSVTLGVVPDYLFEGEGMRIDGISQDRPAQKAGMLPGDVVIGMGKHKIMDMNSYMKALSAFKKGDVTKVIVLRKNQKKTFPVTF